MTHARSTEGAGTSAREHEAATAVPSAQDYCLPESFADRFELLTNVPVPPGTRKLPARDRSDGDREVVLLILDRDVETGAEVDQAKADAVALKKLAAPNVLSVLAAVEEDDKLWIATEIAHGVDYREWVRSRRDHPAFLHDALCMILRTCRALMALSDAGVPVELTPGTLIVAGDGTPKLVGFCFLPPPPSAPDARSFVAPESDSSSGARSESILVYTLGAMLHDVVTGSEPQPDGPLDSVHESGIPALIDVVVRRSLCSDPERRFGSLAQFRATLLAACRHFMSSEVAEDSELDTGRIGEEPHDTTVCLAEPRLWAALATKTRHARRRVAQAFQQALDVLWVPLWGHQPPLSVHSYTVAASGMTDIGHQRENNEDFYGAWSLAAGEKRSGPLTCFDPGGRGGLLVLNDGVGGAMAGEVASLVAGVAMLRQMGSLTDGRLPSANNRRAELLGEAVDAAHTEVRELAQRLPSRGEMGTTLTAVWLYDGSLYTAQVGDSRLYRYRSGILEQLTFDQSPVGRMVERGVISRAEARTHPHRNLIEQALGSGVVELQPDLDWFEQRPGDVLVLCSDGLSDSVDEHAMARILLKCRWRSTETIARKLVAAARERLSTDNTTVLVCRIGPRPRPWCPVGPLPDAARMVLSKVSVRPNASCRGGA